MFAPCCVPGVALSLAGAESCEAGEASGPSPSDPGGDGKIQAPLEPGLSDM